MATHSSILAWKNPMDRGAWQGTVQRKKEIKWSHSVMSDSATPWTVAHQVPPSMEFSRQEYWSGLPFPSLGDLSDLGIECRSPTLHLEAFIIWAKGSQKTGHDWMTKHQHQHILYEQVECIQWMQEWFNM